MSVIFLANATLMGVAASVALGLAVVMFLRLAHRYEAMRREIDRLKREHGEATADLRSRIGAIAQQVDSVHEEVPPLVSRFKEHIPALETRVEGAEKQLSKVALQLKAASLGVETARNDYDHVHALVTKREQQLDALNLKELRHSVTLLRGTVDEHLARRGADLDAVEEAVPGSATVAAAVISKPAAKTKAAQAKPKAKAVSKPPPKAAASKAAAAKTPEAVSERSESKGEPDDVTGARWIFLVMAVLLGAALLAQYVRSL